MKNDCIIVSVESRKGGVGKTTEALNLARILLEKREYGVLFLDVDITGTNATDCRDSFFWKDSCHAVRDTTKLEDPANLLAIFERQFMPGLSMPKFSKDGARKNKKDNSTLVLAPNKINIIGSQIYDLNGYDNGENSDTCICKPSILFDELHAFWFIEFLQKTCEAFIQAIRENEPNRAIAVIIDNSPGYVGIAPAVQEWLTDLGPNKGKFLTISSLDKQDLLSCGHAIHNLHQLYCCKWRASQKFIETSSCDKSTFEELQLARDEEGFFLRLVEAQQSRQVSHDTHACTPDVSGADLTFYLAGNTETGENYLSRPEAYQGLVINRVPRLVKRGVYTYDTEYMYSLMHRKGSNVIQRMLGDDRSSYANWMVSYDESIEYQFVQPMISRRSGRTSRHKSRFEEFQHVIKERYPIPPDKLLQEILHEGVQLHPKILNKAHMYIRKVHEVVTAVIRLVDQSGFSNLTHLIHEEWLPGNILRDFRIALQDVLLEMEGPFVEFAPWESDKDRIDPDTYEFVERFQHSIKLYFMKRELPVPLEFMEQFISSLSVVVALSMSRRWGHPKLDPELPELLGDIAAIETINWTKRRGRSKERLGIQRFLASESLKEGEPEKFLCEFKLQPRRLERGVFSRLYRACALAQARLIDMRQDAEFLIALIQRLVIEDIREASVLPYVRGVAEKVIVRKTLSHESGLKTIAKGFSSIQYMEEFSEILEKLLARWEGPQ